MLSNKKRRAFRSLVLGPLLLSLVVGITGVASATPGISDQAGIGIVPPSGPTDFDTHGNITVRGIEVLGSTGGDVSPVSPGTEVVTYVPQPVKLVDKEALLALNAPKVSKALAGSTASSAAPLGQGGLMQSGYCDVPCALKLWQPLAHQERSYSCGASSGRLVVWGYRKADPSEAAMRAYMHTDRDHETRNYNIPPALNRYPTPAGDRFVVRQLDSQSDYFNAVVTDIYDMHHALINNLNTYPLPYFSHRRLLHYNVTYGYDVSHLGLVNIAEEWDPSVFYSDETVRRNYPDGNPFGTHQVAAEKVWQAIAMHHHLIVW